MTEPLQFILLTAEPEVIQQRLSRRPRHFMKPHMLDSQLAALEPPAGAIAIDVSRPIDEVCAVVASRIRNLI